MADSSLVDYRLFVNLKVEKGNGGKKYMIDYTYRNSTHVPTVCTCIFTYGLGLN